MSAPLSIPLTLIPSRKGTESSVAAWFVASSDTNVWLEVCVQLDPQLQRWQWLPVPMKVGGSEVGGALLLCENKLVPSEIPKRALAYTCRAGKLYFPAEAVLNPQVTDDELLQHLPLAAYVYHPGVGLIGFEKSEFKGLDACVSAGMERPSDWNRAQAGIAAPKYLIEVVLDAPPPTVKQLMQDGKGDIGSQAKPPDATKNPSSGAANPSPLSKAADALQQGMLKAGQWLSGALGGGANTGTGSGAQGSAGSRAGGDDSNSWLKNLAQWPAEKLAAWVQRLQEQREKEIDRLMRMMEQNPDEGLKHALPLTGQGHRGMSPPGANLGTRDPNFNLGRLKGGGGSADAWALPWETQNKLREKYRQAANRELGLGRYKRAAYIFAELLGDFHSAALALKQGKHFRDAAAIYSEMLNMPLQAAQCLADGGLLLEAVDLYEQHQAWVSAGDLYTRLDRTEDAERVYRKAADRMIEQNDRLGAAEIMQLKVKSVDGALAILWSSWPRHHQAQACLERAYHVLKSENRHGEATHRLTWLAKSPYSVNQTGALVRFLCDLKTTYPAAEVREQSEDMALSVAGKRLAAADTVEATSLLNSIRSLHPEDRLLGRDALRFGDLLKKKPVPAAPVPAPVLLGSKKKMAVKIGDASLSDNSLIRFYSYQSNGDGIYATAREGNSNTWRIYRRGWKVPKYQIVKLNHNSSTVIPRVMPSRRIANPAWICGIKVEDLKFPAFDESLETQAIRSIFVEPEHHLGAALDEQDNLYALYADRSGGLALMNCQSNGTIRGSVSLGDVFSADPIRPVPMVARRERVYFAQGGMIHLVESEKEQSTPVFDISGRGAIRSLCTTASYTALVLAATQDEGGAVLWPEDHRAGTILRFGDGLHNPVACFTRSGYLVAAAATQPHAPGEGRIYNLGRNELRLISTFSFPAGDIVSVVPGEGLDEFAICLQYGGVHVFQVQ